MKRLFLCFLAALLVAGLTGCGSGSEPPAPKEGAEKPAAEGGEEAAGGTDIVLTPEAAASAGIKTETARRVAMQAELNVPGTVTNTAQGKALVTPPVDGKITRLFVSVSDNVRAGQPIAVLQSSDLAEASTSIIEAERGVISAGAAVREAKAEIDLANARLRTAKAALGRQEELARTGAFSQPALQQATRDLNEAEAELESAVKEDAAHEVTLARAERLFKLDLISKSELESERLHHELDHIRLEKAKKNVANAQKTLQRETTIASKNLLNTREIQTAEAEARAANLELRQAKIRHQTAQSGVIGANKGLQAARAGYSAHAGGGRASGGSVTVVAPIGGIVTERRVTLGQAVERTTEICEIENLKSVWVTASVPEKEIAKARRGGRAQLTVSAYPGRIFHGILQIVGSRLDAKSRTMPVQILVDNASGLLRPDMFAKVAIGIGTSEPALAVPLSAITEEHEATGAILFIEESEHRFMKKPVTLGRRNGAYVEILEGLEPGAKVVTKGAFILMSESKKGELKGDED